MNKKGLFFDMMFAAMAFLGLMTYLVGLYLTITGPDVYLDFSQNYTFTSEYAQTLLEIQSIQQSQLSTVGLNSLAANCPEYVHDFSSSETCYSQIISTYFDTIDISSRYDDMSFAYVLNNSILHVYSIQDVHFEYSSPMANVSLTKPIQFDVVINPLFSTYLSRIVELEDVFTSTRRCVLLDLDVCSEESATYERSIIDENSREVETIFTDSITGLKARSIDLVSQDVLNSLTS